MSANLTIADDLKAARALLEKGWCKGTLERDGSYCAMGAIRMATAGSVHQRNTRTGDAYAVISGLLEGTEFERRLDLFNNAPERTQQDMLDLFSKGLAELGALA